MPCSRLFQLTRALPGLSMTVLPSSVCPGFGVYALQKIAKNTYIGEYPGSLITDDADTHLRDLLRQWRVEDNSRDQERILILKRYFNISIEALLPQRYRYQAPIKLSGKEAVNWRKILITIYAYSFQTDSGTLVPSRISTAGPPLFSLDQHENATDYSSLTPFINEAPPGSCKNLLTGRPQRPFYNVDVTIRGERVIFYSKRSIPAGNELFFFYGPSYNRDYPIHMSANNCGWGPQDFEDEDEEDRALSADFFEDQKTFRESETVLSFITAPRRDEMRLSLKAIFSRHSARLLKEKSS